MNKRIKNYIALVISAMMVPSVFAACSNKKAETKTSSANPNAKHTTLTVEVFDRGTPGQAPLDNNYWTKYINNNFGKKFNTTVKFVTVPRTQEVDKLNVMMAANQAPDICFTYDSNVVYNYVKQGGLTQLDDLLSKYGSNITKYLGKDLLAYGSYSGKQMAIPAKRTVLAAWGSYIRQDWLDKLGMKAPTTTEELYNTLVAFRDKNPGNVKGVIPWGAWPDPLNFASLIDSFWTNMSEKDFATLPDWQKPGNKEGFKFLNKLYNEKLISPDFAIDKTGKQFNSDFSNGKVGFISTNFDYPLRANPGIYDNLKKNVSGAAITPVETFKNNEGKYYKYSFSPNGINIMIPRASKNAVQAIEYLNWMADSKVIFDLQNGKEGVNYKLVDGIPQNIEVTGDMAINSPQNMDYEILTNGTDLGDPAKNVKAVAKSFAGFEEIATKEIKYAQTDTFTTFYFNSPNEANAKYSKTLSDKGTDMYAKLITCKPAAFDKLYDSLVQEYMEAGGNAVKEDAIKIYDQMQKEK